MKYLYKYPQTAFPYADLVETNRGSARTEFEYELLDTEAFVECAKTSPEDVFVRITVHNRGPEPAAVHVLPTLWFRNEWFWHASTGQPSLSQVATGSAGAVIQAVHSILGELYLHCDREPTSLLFTENDTNA